MKLLKWLLIVCAAGMVVGGGYVCVKGYSLLDQALSSESLEDKIDELRQKDGYTSLAELPDTYLQAVVAVEDHRFYSHHGVDWRSILRACWNNLKAGEIVEGGSTITQQLARNLYLNQDQTLSRKVAEALLAWQLEDQYDKEEILEFYVNIIYFGDGYYGVGDACRGYFHKEPSQMNEDECTLLAGIPNAPSVYAPTVNPELALERQDHPFLDAHCIDHLRDYCDCENPQVYSRGQSGLVGRIRKKHLISCNKCRRFYVDFERV